MNYIQATLPLFAKLTRVLQGYTLFNPLFSPINYEPVLTIQERTMWNRDEPSHVEHWVNGDKVKVVKIQVYNGELISNHVRIPSGEKSDAHILMVLVHELLHIYLNHVKRGLIYYKSHKDELTEISFDVFQEVWAYVEHVELTHIHRLIDSGITDYFLTPPPYLSHFTPAYIQAEHNMNDILTKYAKELKKQPLPSILRPDVPKFVNIDTFADADGVEVSTLTGDGEPILRKTMNQMYKDLEAISNNDMLKLLASVQTIIHQKALAVEQFWGFDSFSMKNEPTDYLERISGLPYGRFILDISGSMNHEIVEGKTRIGYAKEIINALHNRGMFTVIPFNTRLHNALKLPLDDIRCSGGTTLEVAEHLLRDSILITDAEDIPRHLLDRTRLSVVIDNPTIVGKNIINIGEKP